MIGRVVCRICKGEGCATCGGTGTITPRRVLGKRTPDAAVGAIPRFMGTMAVFAKLPRGTHWRGPK